MIEQFGFEGAVAKRRDSIYVPGAAPGTWLKHKTQLSADFVVGSMITTGPAVDEILVGRTDGIR
jgi:ATP-dependent DNA ligase